MIMLRHLNCSLAGMQESYCGHMNLEISVGNQAAPKAEWAKSSLLTSLFNFYIAKVKCDKYHTYE